MPALVQAWFPRHVGRASAIYSNGLLVGEVLAATLTLPFLLALFGWQVALSAWSLLCAVALALWLLLTPATERAQRESEAGGVLISAVIASRPELTSAWSIAERSSRSARAMAITWPLKVR